MTTVTRDILVGKLATFELSEFRESHGKSETAFRTSVSSKQKYDPGESSCCVSIYEREKREMEEQGRELDELEALISQRLPKGAGKYDGKLPLKCFSYDKIGHFASRCPERMSRHDKHDKFERHDRSDKYDRYDKHDKNDKPYKPY